MYVHSLSLYIYALQNGQCVISAGCLPCIMILRSIEYTSTMKACVKKELEANPTCTDAKDAILKFLDSDFVFGNRKNNQKICEDIKSCKHSSN